MRPRARSELVGLFQAIKGATLLSRRGICVDCISLYCRWQLLSVLPALTPGPEVAGDVAAVVVSMAAVAEAFMAATVVGAFAAATGAEAFAAVTEVVASAVVTEVIEVATVAGDMDAVTATGAVGDMGLASG